MYLKSDICTYQEGNKTKTHTLKNKNIEDKISLFGADEKVRAI